MKIILSHRIKKNVSKAVSLLLITTMWTPEAGTLITYGADYLANQPRSVDFMRSNALTLGA